MAEQGAPPDTEGYRADFVEDFRHPSSRPPRREVCVWRKQLLEAARCIAAQPKGQALARFLITAIYGKKDMLKFQIS